jgi:hypothetical protein
LIWDKKNRKAYEEIFLPLERKLEKQVSSYTGKELSLFIELIHKTAEILHEETIRLTKKLENQQPPEELENA